MHLPVCSEDIVAAAVEEFGSVDILVNNATAGGGNDLWRYTEEEWDLSRWQALGLLLGVSRLSGERPCGPCRGSSAGNRPDSFELGALSPCRAVTVRLG
jgi:hypothetical protein